jgi:DNA processing protein
MTTIEPKGVSPDEAGYPTALSKLFGSLLPPEIWVIGNTSDRGLEVAADCARQLSAAGAVVVSGYAPGVDMASHEAALKSGGRTIIVLPEGIDHFRIKKTVKDIWDWNRVLVVSQFSRRAIWRADRAMERNNVIVGISDAVVVIEAREQGGTLHAGFSALRLGKPLFVALYDEMNGSREGNQRLIREGGKPLLRNRVTSQAQMRDVFADVGLAA